MWSFFGLLATSAIWAGQKMAQDGEKIIMQEQKEKYFKLLDEAAHEYMENATDVKLQKELEQEICDKYGNVKENSKYFIEWVDMAKDFECFDEQNLFLLEEYDVEKYREYCLAPLNCNPRHVISFFLAKHGKSYLKHCIDTVEKCSEYEDCRYYISYGCEEGYQALPGIWFKDCCAELTIKELRKNGFPYNLRFIKCDNVGYINDLCIWDYNDFREINLWDYKAEALKYIKENSFVGTPQPKGNAGFFILDEFQHLHLWGKETEDKNFYKIY